MRCPLLCSGNNQNLIKIEQVPTTLHQVCSSEAEAKGVATGNVDMVQCIDCGLTFNQQFDPSLVKYDAAYNNETSYSSTFVGYFDGVVSSLAEQAKANGVATVLEVGCGSGKFLSALVSRLPGATGVGYDPAYSGSADGASLTFHKKMFLGESEQADLVVSRHLIEHLQSPIEFINTLSKSLSSNGLLFLETPCLDWIVENDVYYDYFYEHCVLFNQSSLHYLLEMTGFKVLKMEKVFGEQFITVLAARKNMVNRKTLQGTLKAIKGAHSVGIWGVGAKGVMLANILDPKCEYIRCGIEINPAKIGKFIPGTGHPIISRDEMAGFGITDVILANPNYRAEAETYIRDNNLNIEIIEA